MVWKAYTLDHYAIADTERKALENLRFIYEKLDNCKFPIMEEFIYIYKVKTKKDPKNLKSRRFQLKKYMLEIGCSPEDVRAVSDYDDEIVEYLFDELKKSVNDEKFDQGLLELFPSLREATKKYFP